MAKQFTVTLPDDLEEQLEQYLAKSRELTFEEVIVAALKEYLQNRASGERD